LNRLGPVLVVPYRERVQRVKKDNDTGKTTVEIDFVDGAVALTSDLRVGPLISSGLTGRTSATH
jgi:hypothetical protein